MFVIHVLDMQSRLQSRPEEVSGGFALSLVAGLVPLSRLTYRSDEAYLYERNLASTHYPLAVNKGLLKFVHAVNGSGPPVSAIPPMRYTRLLCPLRWTHRTIL
jgi:hypothetical protein